MQTVHVSSQDVEHILTKAQDRHAIAIAMTAVDRVMMPMAPVFALMQLWAQSHSTNFIYLRGPYRERFNESTASILGNWNVLTIS